DRLQKSTLRQLKTFSMRDEHGASLFELAMVLPFLVFLLFVSVDVAMYLQSYLRASHVLREGLRIAAVTPGLSVGQSINDMNANVGHRIVQQRINGLLHAEDYNITSTNFDGATAGMNMVSNPGSVEQNLTVRTQRNLGQREVEIDLSGEYSSIFGTLVGNPSFTLQYTVRGTAPYLLN
ncbi:MAG: pilus assembly protein, partial [Deltaproteobacteria bacterium]|nr:pilus assembly protein [Deltaproteobacteria bacterium]